MAKNGAEPAGAMGSDTPLAALSHTHPPLFEYFKQMFAQVTNPPIDALREKIVTSTTVYVGAQGNLLEESAENCKVLKINNPILTETDLLKIKNMKVPGFKVETVSICYYKNTPLARLLRLPRLLMPERLLGLLTRLFLLVTILNILVLLRLE